MQADTGLKYKPANWRETLASFLPLEHNDNKLEIEPFPDEQVLAYFAQLVYSDCTKDLNLPEGWQLLATAQNNSFWNGNGYFGCVVWNGLQQQVVIAHRGTDPLKLGPIWVDIKGTYFNQYTDHMNSAVTFVDDVKEAILVKNKQEFCRFVLSISGHSLGAWLAGVTTLTVKYLKKEELQKKNTVKYEKEKFCRIASPGEGLHAHTLALDSPGVDDIMIKICKDFDMRYNRSMSSKQLDITTYFAAPNPVNCTGYHVGDIYQLHVKRVPPSWFKDCIGLNNMETHAVDIFIEAFKNGKDTYVVQDWPQGSSERKCFHKSERLHDSHILQPNDEQVPPESSDGSHRSTATQPVEGSAGSMHSEEKSRYRIIPSDGNTRQLGVFSEEEFNFAYNWSLFKRDEGLKLTEIDNFKSQHNLGQIKFPEFKIDTVRNTITCATREDLRTVLRQVKQLLRWFPGIMDAMTKQNNSIKLSPLYVAGQAYLRNLPDIMDCGDTLELESFLGSSEHVLIIETTDLKFEAARINKILMGIINTDRDELNLTIDRHTFLSWNDLVDMDKAIIDMEALGKTDITTINNMLVLEFDSPIDGSLTNYDKLKKYIQNLQRFNKKLVMIVSKAYDLQLFNDNEGLVLIEPSVKHWKAFELSDLTPKSREEILARDAIVLGEETLSFQILVGDDGGSDELRQFISPILMNMVTNYNYIAEIELNT